MKPRRFGILFGPILLFLLAPGAKGSPGPELGQWIWSARDARIFTETHERLPGLVPSPWLATLSFRDGRVVMTLALAPASVSRGPIASVLRFDESFHRAWDQVSPSGLAAEIDVKLATLGRRIAAAGGEIREWQLDYDCPERRLGEWAQVLRRLTAGALQGRPVWVTSLLAHLRDPEFGSRLQGAVAGHILQVFDTGETPQSHPPDQVSTRLAAHALPFRLGLGAFERRSAEAQVTAHRDWFFALPIFSQNPWYRGLWVFPGGRRWVSLLPAPERN